MREGIGSNKSWGIRLAMIALAAALLAGCSDEEPEVSGPTTTTIFEPSCQPVETFPSLGRDHLDNGTKFDDYNSRPASSGPHWQRPADAGYYGTRVPEAQLVHNLEHGQILLYYRALKRKDLHRVQQYVLKANGSVIGARAPEGVTDPITFVAWRNVQRCDGFSEDLADDFRREFQGRGPEQVYPPFKK